MQTKIVDQLITLSNENILNWVPDSSYERIPNIDHSLIDLKKSAVCLMGERTTAYLITIKSEIYLFISIDFLKSIPRYIIPALRLHL